MNTIFAAEVSSAMPSGATPYETLRQRHLLELQKRLPIHLERLQWPAEKLRAEREARLRELVRFACERSPWHRRRLAHLNPDSLGERNLDLIPVMTKDDLMENFDDIITDPRLTLERVEAHLASLNADAYLLDRFHAIASGGSSGRRGVFVWDWESWADLYLTLIRYSVRDYFPTGKPASKPIALAAIGAEHPSHASSSVYQTFSNPVTGIVHRFPVSLPFDQIVAGLNRVQPDVLGGYPSALRQLAFETRDGRLSISPRIVISAAEPLLPETRALLRSTWKVPIINAWAASEAGGMGIQCGHGPGLHLSDDLLIIELVDAAGRRVPPGVRSAKLFVTNLYNPLLPLIRFEITDEITLLDDRCPCGSAHRLVADVQGRLDDCFFYPEVGTVHPHLFRSHLGREANIIEYQVCQTARGAAIRARCRGPVDFARLELHLVEELQRAGLAQPQVSIVPVDQLERHAASGKLKRFLPLPGSSRPN